MLKNYNATVIAQTKNPYTGVILTTFQVTMPRFLLAQLNKHRILSSNTESNRAVPFSKKDKKLKENPFFPLVWGTNQKGMQASTPLTGYKEKLANFIWNSSLQTQRMYGWALNLLNVHKQISNRLTEPFQLVDVVLTGSQWENFFNLRLAPSAQPEIQMVASLMKIAYENNLPNLNKDNFLIDLEENVFRILHLPYITNQEKENYPPLILLASSAARCARVSYFTHNGTTSIEADIKLFLKLVKSKHWSALEHCAIAVDSDALLGHFISWVSFRKLFENESGDDSLFDIPYFNPKQINDIMGLPLLNAEMLSTLKDSP